MKKQISLKLSTLLAMLTLMLAPYVALATVYIQGTLFTIVDDGIDDYVYGPPPRTTPTPRTPTPVPYTPPNSPAPRTPGYNTPAPYSPAPRTTPPYVTPGYPTPPAYSTPRPTATPAPYTPAPRPPTALNDPVVNKLVHDKIVKNGIANLLGNVVTAINSEVRGTEPADAVTQARELAQLAKMGAAVAQMQVFEEMAAKDRNGALQAAAEFYLESPKQNGSPLIRMMQISDEDMLTKWMASTTVPNEEVTRMLTSAGRVIKSQ